jgi:bacteriocin biosynthesis cyclodehydratase domain-containing protein
MEGPGPIDDILERSGPFNLVMVEVDESAERATAANIVCLGAGVTALFHELTTLGGVVGPTVASFTTSCYECLMTRHSSHLRFYDEHVASVRSLRSGEVQVRQPAILAGGAAMTGGILSLEAMRLLTGTPPPATTDAILRADFRTLQVRREPLLGVPGCPACSQEAEVLLGR